MQTSRLHEWLAGSGLTVEEAIWVQPGYEFCDPITVDIQGPTEAACGDTIELTTAPVKQESCGASYQWTRDGGPASLSTDRETATLTFPADLEEGACYSAYLTVENQGPPSTMPCIASVGQLRPRGGASREKT
jgi:hypothetical protein